MKTYLPKILVTGGQGQLSSALKNHVAANQFNLKFYNHAELDITQSATIENRINEIKPDLIINNAAYTAVDKAENDKEHAEQINHIGAKNLAIICKQLGMPLIHLSTDYIFDGEKKSAYTESDDPNPINFYGVTKLHGEQEITDTLTDYIILRVSGIFSEYGQNFLKTMLRLGQEKKELRVVADQVTCPTAANDIAGALLKIAATYHATQKIQWGTYHYCSANPISWHEFASRILSEAGLYQSLTTTEIKAIPTSEYPTPAKRPMHSVLACNKISDNFSIKQPSWEDAISLTIKRLYTADRKS